MKSRTKAILAAIGTLTALLQAPQVQAVIGTFLTAHPNVSAIAGGVLAAAATIHVPKKAA